MANQKHLDCILQNHYEWNRWRNKHPDVKPDLRGANLSRAHLDKVNLSGVRLEGAVLRGADLKGANLNEADLSGADLSNAHLQSARLEYSQLNNTKLYDTDFSRADLTNANLKNAKFRITNFSGARLWGAIFSPEADLREVILTQADLREVNFYRAKLQGADLSGAILVGASIEGANLTNCSIYGIAAWDIQLDEHTVQNNLTITPPNQPTITVDNLEVAQFIYLILNNQKIRYVINTIGQKGVLILGRFSKERKLVLDALQEKLRSLNFLPIVFDFERSTERDFTETIMTLAGLSCFIIADITNPKSSPLELQATVPNYMIPFVPIIQEGEQPFSMFQDLKGKYDWVLDILVYDTLSNLVIGFERAVVTPAIEMRDELLSRKVEQLRTRHIGDFL